MILIETTPEGIQSDTGLTPEEKREILKAAPPKIKVASTQSLYYLYGQSDDRMLTLTTANQGIVNVSFEWDRKRA